MDPRVTFVTLVVRDLATSRRFYVDGLGWHPELDVPDEVVMIRVADTVILSLWQEDKAEAELGPVGRSAGAAPVTLAHNVASRADVDRVVPEMEAAGATVVTAPQMRDWGGYSGYVEDPDGFRWEIAFNPGPIGQSVLTRPDEATPVTDHPVLMHTALDATDCRGLAEFYRELLGLRYRPGDEPSLDGDDDADWLVLVDDAGRRVLAVNSVEALPRSTWPDEGVPKQMHQDFRVPTVAELERQRSRAERLGARLVHDRRDSQEPLYVLVDPAGHPFCLLVSAG